MKSLEECIVEIMEGTYNEIFPYLPYILQDFWEMGSSPHDMISLIEKHSKEYSSLKVLDLGCGKGAVSIKIAEKLNCECWGFDGMEEFIDDANKKAVEYGVKSLCHFEKTDIREKIKDLPPFDVIILGAIGPVFGNYYETLTNLKKVLKKGGLILIADAYIEDSSVYSHPVVLKKKELLSQVSLAGMVLIDELIPEEAEEINAGYERDFNFIELRCNELIKEHPMKKYLFESYIQRQIEEYDTLETKMICLTMAFKEQ